jgi:hypothetical protein
MVGLPKSKEVLEYVTKVLESKRLEVTPKGQKQESAHREKIINIKKPQSLEERVQADAISRVEKMRGIGFTDKNIKRAFSQYIDNGINNSGLLQSFANDYMARPQETRDNGTTTFTR